MTSIKGDELPEDYSNSSINQTRGGDAAKPPMRPEAHLRVAAGGPRHLVADTTGEHWLLTRDWTIFCFQHFERAAWLADEGAMVRRRGRWWRRRASCLGREAPGVSGVLAHLSVRRGS